MTKIGTAEFTTKAAAESYIRRLLSRYGNGQVVTGSDEDFVRSILHCHPNRDRHAIYQRRPIESVRKTCRTLIADQVECARRKAFSRDIALTCPVTGERITRELSDIHHIPDFVDLVDSWLMVNGLTAEDIEIVPSKEYQKPDRFQDEWLEENWREFHRINATLVAVHPRANRSVLRRKSSDGLAIGNA